MRNFTIQFRIIAMISVFLVLLLGTTSLALFSQWASYKKSEEFMKIIDETRQIQVDFKIQVQEWKNTLIRGNDPKQYDKYWGRVLKRASKIEEEFKSLAKHLEDVGLESTEVKAALVEYKRMISKYKEGISHYDQSTLNSITKVDKIVSGVDRQTNKNLDKIVEEFRLFALEETRKFTFTLIKIMGLLLIIVIALSLTISTFFIRSIKNPINSLKGSLERLSQYDLTVELDDSGNDEISDMSKGVMTLTQSLKDLVSQIKQSSLGISASTNELSSGTNQMNEMVNHQNRSLEQISVATDESAVAINEIRGQSASTTNNVNQISHNVEAVEKAMQELESSSAEIVDVMSVINDITDQINLLALNAAIEAARAGDAGRGFAVVADEVRKLANNTSASTVKITEVTNSLTENVAFSASSVEKITRSIGEIGSGVENVSNSLEQQSAATEEVSATVQEFSSSMQTVLTNISETNQAAQDISQQAVAMEREVQKFSV